MTTSKDKGPFVAMRQIAASQTTAPLVLTPVNSIAPRLALLQAVGGNAHFRTDATAPGGAGHILVANEFVEYDGDLTALRFDTGGGVTIEYSLYG